ncbi:MAG TPA: GNAT family N-acetyltransferase [Nitriliruptorales bacterium]|nr:GNAT family N-acetyltransferase [Nitriliruptorales bacterium]
MKGSVTHSALDVRPFGVGDEAAVLDLLTASLGPSPVGPWGPAFFRWKHLQNPYGRSLMLVAERAGRLVGFRAFMRWRFRAGQQELRAVRAVDTATHPGARREGVFSTLTAEALTALRADTDFVFNTPNERSLPGYTKMGWQVVGRLPVAIRVRHPVRFLRALPSLLEGQLDDAVSPRGLAAMPAAEVLSDPRLPALLHRVDQAASADGVLRTDRSMGYLRWRYTDIPGLVYHGLLEGDGDLRGVALFRVRPRGRSWEAAVVEVIAMPYEHRTVARLLGAVARSSAVDHVITYVPPGTSTARGARRAGYLPAPGRATLVTRPLHDRISPDPTRASSWGVGLGDLELF